ncbi:hypothetical protein H5410_006381 [Solanum commersonii]|uniref:Uncharacterized protein n=1 Tax=Solanum commersonii TaxID=4109 RepID=A0A9J6AA45_SOLCO|nr:hypothetical protein H5410_006381 [Solanum commersonii]
MENGGDSLVPKLAGWNLNDSNNPKNNDGLYQVLKAVEAAEATIKQQMFGRRSSLVALPPHYIVMVAGPKLVWDNMGGAGAV